MDKLKDTLKKTWAWMMDHKMLMLGAAVLVLGVAMYYGGCFSGQSHLG